MTDKELGEVILTRLLEKGLSREWTTADQAAEALYAVLEFGRPLAAIDEESITAVGALIRDAQQGRRVPLKDAEGHVIGYAEVFEDGRYEGHITIPFKLPDDPLSVSFRVEREWNERGL